MRKMMFTLTMGRSKQYFVEKYGEDFWRQFKRDSSACLAEISPQVTDIGKSVFSFNYSFAPAYIAWYKTLRHMGVAPSEIDRDLWAMNERMASLTPGFIMRAVGKCYLGSFQKQAKQHVQRQQAGMLYPLDWRISYRSIDKNTFEMDISECAFLKLAEKFDARGMLPGICRMDYLFANRMGNGLTRTQTLGDGDRDSGLVHTVKVTSANVHDVTVTPELLTGEETVAYGDSGYLGADKLDNAVRKNRSGKKIRYKINRRPSQGERGCARSTAQRRRREREKSSIRSEVEHVFAVVKQQLRYRKTRYRGLQKQTAKLNIMFALANLILADRPCLAN